jgi:hypothetical protein
MPDSIPNRIQANHRIITNNLGAMYHACGYRKTVSGFQNYLLSRHRQSETATEHTVDLVNIVSMVRKICSRTVNIAVDVIAARFQLDAHIGFVQFSVCFRIPVLNRNRHYPKPV